MTIGTPGRPPVHLLHTDVPGEWFTDWSREAANAPGAQWVADAADAFLILADSAALSGADRGIARGDYELLAQRVASVANGRPVLPVQTKADVKVPDPIQAVVDEMNARLFGVETLRVSAKSESFGAITEPVDRGVRAALAQRYALPGPGPDSWALQLLNAENSKEAG